MAEDNEWGDRDCSILLQSVLVAEGVKDFESLCDLMVLEQFKTIIPARVATYVNEQKVKTAAKAAVLADELEWNLKQTLFVTIVARKDTGKTLIMIGSLIYLQSELVQGEVTIALRPSLPVEGVSLILGNNPAGGRVWRDVAPPPVVRACPSVSLSDVCARDFPEAFPGCAVTVADKEVEFAKVSNAPELACSSQDPETTTSVDTEPNASDAYDSTNSAVASCSDECEVTAPLDSIENELNLSSTPSTVTTLPNDPAKWAETLTESMKEVLIQRGAKSFHNRHSHYPASVRNSGLGGKTRCLNNEHFTSHLPNGQRVQREWLMYSPSTGNVYCFACKLFSPKTHSFVTGYCDWKHSERFGEHEQSAEHITCMQAVLNHAKGATVDADLFKQFQAESSYWRQVLQRVVAVIKFLAERGLAFRGKNESLGSPLNGNYLGILEVLAEFDPFLKDHIRKFGQMGRGNTSYLSSTICEEFIELMGAKTKQAIADELQASKYYSIIVDSTPDLSHVDQLTFIFRFVSKEGSVVERFVGFEPITSHTGESLANCVMSVLETLGLELSNCRGQAYDNASNMSGRYNGLQAHLKKSNPLIHYIPCAAHSLNLVGVNSIDRCGNEVSKYFDLIQSIYNFTTASTHRWDRVFGNSNIDLTLKALSNTRWSCRAESTKALWQNYSKIKAALQVISTDDTEKRDTRTEADSLVRKLDSLEMAFMAGFWDTVLSRFQATSLQLQKADMDLGTAVRLLESLRTFVLSQRDLFDHFEQKALNMLGGTPSYRAERTRKRKKFADESCLREGNCFK
ncbi:zinc finger MYM-type protein 1-like [Cyprinodon tularosa]|uniref:zinc finger MYM-type protein 1-like n=1 Tax=Cyprinodon tularosa TaxID=77115 RepID=UPI0018E22B8B|nr:zinc finger MYM-type protein 1-like [Cyprinodon tularosa]